jgi:hypothetical protein
MGGRFRGSARRQGAAEGEAFVASTTNLCVDLLMQQLGGSVESSAPSKSLNLQKGPEPSETCKRRWATLGDRKTFRECRDVPFRTPEDMATWLTDGTASYGGYFVFGLRGPRHLR